MRLLGRQGRSQAGTVQATGRAPLVSVAWRAGLLAPLLLAGCHGQQEGPVDWWHDLQGGTIAEHRPPPPGADLPYPNINTIPPRPILPSESYRRTISNTLIAQRDDAERLAARNPITAVTPPPPPAPAAKPAAGSETANATLPAAAAPAPKPAPPPAAPAPAPGVRLAGAPADEPNLPPVPDAPPAPASFESVAAQPAPTPAPPLPVHAPAKGTQVLFATGSDALDQSEHPVLKEASGLLLHAKVSIEGHGDAADDSPNGQEAALHLAIARSKAVAKQLIVDGVAPRNILLSATAFGRGVTVQAVP